MDSSVSCSVPSGVLFSAYLNFIKKTIPSDPHRDQGSLTPANLRLEQVVECRAQRLPGGERGN